jgi:hypothetical protein
VIGAHFWRSAGKTFGRSGPPKGLSHSLCVFGLGFKAFETTSRPRLKDTFQEACMCYEGSL